MIKEGSYINTTIIEERKLNAVTMDVFSRLLMDRIIFLGTAINSDVANIITGQLLWLDSIDPGKEITMYINSPGGSVYDGLGLYDLMQYIQTKGIKIRTVNIGQACSMAFILLIGGTKGCRESLPNCSAMIHELSSGDFGTTSQFEDTAKEMRRVQTILNEIITKHSNAELIELCKRKDFWLSAEEALKYNVIDKIL